MWDVKIQSNVPNLVLRCCMPDAKGPFENVQVWKYIYTEITRKVWLSADWVCQWTWSAMLTSEVPNGVPWLFFYSHLKGTSKRDKRLHVLLSSVIRNLQWYLHFRIICTENILTLSFSLMSLWCVHLSLRWRSMVEPLWNSSRLNPTMQEWGKLTLWVKMSSCHFVSSSFSWRTSQRPLQD